MAIDMEEYGKQINHYGMWEIEKIVLTQTVIHNNHKHNYEERKEIDIHSPGAWETKTIKRWLNKFELGE